MFNNIFLHDEQMVTDTRKNEATDLGNLRVISHKISCHLIDFRTAHEAFWGTVIGIFHFQMVV